MPARRAWAALSVLCVANFLILLDTTIVNTAAPSITTSLGITVDSVLWIINGYLLAFAALLIVAGRLGDLVGPRTMFVVGLAVFTVASVLCGLAGSAGVLIAARVLQGVGAAILLPQALVLIASIFPADRRGLAFGLFTAMAGLAAVSGPTLGGLLVTEAGWRYIFMLNVPIGVIWTILALRFLPDLRAGRSHRLDPVGVLLLSGGLAGVVFALVEGSRYAWGRVGGPVTIPRVLVAALVLLIVFVWWERRQREPLVPLDLFRDREFTVATAVTVLSSFALYGFLFVFVLETQTMLGMSPVASGLTALPWTVTLSAVAPVAGRLADRVGGRVPLAAGLTVQALGVLGVAILPGRTSTAVTYFFPLVLIGIGMGLSIAPTTTAAMRGIAADRVSAASGVLNTARQAGAALGAALVGAVLQNRLLGDLHTAAVRRSGALPSGTRDRFVAGVDTATARGLRLGTGQSGVTVPQDTPAALASQLTKLTRDVFHDAFVAASRPTLGVVAGALLLGAALALLMRHHLPAGEHGQRFIIDDGDAPKRSAAPTRLPPAVRGSTRH